MASQADDRADAATVCSATGNGRAAAIDAYERTCSVARKDCDRVPGGGNTWICASVSLDNGRLPGGSPVPPPASTAPSVPDPAPPGGASSSYGGVGLEPNLSDGLPTGSSGTSELQLRSNVKKDTRPIAPNVATFRTDCHFSHMNFDDAIVAPGQPGKAHLHAYFGNTDVDAFTDPMQVGNKGNSTCAGGRANRSAYWIPALLDTKNGNRPLTPDSAIIYYKAGWQGEKPEKVTAPPNGLRVLAGNQNNSAPLSSNRFDRHLHWSCGPNKFIPNDRDKGFIPTDCRPGDYLKLQVRFPQCWDGKNLDSADHRSHMRQLGGAVNRRLDCPKSHPVLIPRMTINAIWRVPSTGSAGLRLSSDTYDRSRPAGLSAHGDWIVGWDQKVMERMLDGCFRNPADDCGHNNFNDGGGLAHPKK